MQVRLASVCTNRIENFSLNMTKQEAKKRIEKLKKVINHHRYLYHVLDKQEISDFVLDSLKHELYKLEQQFPELVTGDSPTQRIEGKRLLEFKKVKHILPMLSIEDIFSEKELQDWENYLKRLLPGEKINYFCECKIDGFAVELIYQNGIFTLGSTRGDGLVGEDVTQNLKTIESIPLRLKNEIPLKIPRQFIVRGEVYMERNDFEELNKQLDGKYANPRNLAAGSIRQLDSKVAASRPLKFLAYDIVTDIGQKQHSEEHSMFLGLGFRADAGKICKDLSEIVNFWREIAKKRETFPYQIDGVVINVNDNAVFKKLGVAGKSSRGSRAFKFSPKQATTKISDIKIQIGRTGALTPVAVLEPVEVEGTTITRATLHNEDEIKRLGVKIGDTVIVERAGDVIPAVAKVLIELRSGQEKEFHFPHTCPSCRVELIRKENEAVWRCLSPHCSAKKKENLYYFVSKKAFNIEGLGPKIIDRLIDENLIFQAADIFQLKEGDLLPLERFAEKSSKNLMAAIQKSKEIALARFVYSLGIRHVGEETAVDLADYFSSFKNFKKARKEELERIPNIGPATAESIYGWLQDKNNQKLIEDLIKAGVKIKDSKIKKQNLELKGKKFVLTGSLEKMAREEAAEKIRLKGGSVSQSLSKNTDYLVAGKDPGSKLEKSKKLGVKVIEEKEFLSLIE